MTPIAAAGSLNLTTPSHSDSAGAPLSLPPTLLRQASAEELELDQGTYDRLRGAAGDDDAVASFTVPAGRFGVVLAESLVGPEGALTYTSSVPLSSFPDADNGVPRDLHRPRRRRLHHRGQHLRDHLGRLRARRTGGVNEVQGRDRCRDHCRPSVAAQSVSVTVATTGAPEAGVMVTVKVLGGPAGAPATRAVATVVRDWPAGMVASLVRAT